MHKYGLSVYPNHSSTDDIINYLDLAKQYGFSRIFTCLLSADGDKDQILRDFKRVISHANSCGMEVIADINPRVFGDLNLSYNDLSLFSEMGAAGIRLDLGFTGREESLMTYNNHGIKVELNMSSGTKYLDNILTYLPNRDQLIGCHNFYPQRFTGLSREHFMKCSRQFKAEGLRTAAFVTSHAAEIGPWPIMEGLPTLEEHRDLPIDVQAKDLLATGLIDDVIIGNAFASEEELKALSEVDHRQLTFDVVLEEGLSGLESKIVLEEPHFNRGDVSEYVIRSTQSRVKYRGEAFKPFNTREIRRGDLMILNDDYFQYAGEMQIALKDIPNDGKRNVVGRIKEDEIFLLGQVLPWQTFKLKQSQV